MSISAVIVMIIGITVIWGGLAASILFALKKNKEAKSK